MLIGCHRIVGAVPHTRTKGADLLALQRAVSPPLGTPAHRLTGISAPSLVDNPGLARHGAGSARMPRNHESLMRACNQPAPARPDAGLLTADPAIMNPPASTSRLGTEFDDFLFAPLGEDRNGLPLSIVSLLGRMDLDPWREADRLAALPAEAAVHRLASLLAALPVASLTEADPGTMAASLIALLPARTAHKAPSPVPAINASAAAHPRVVISALLFAIYLIWLLCRFEGTREDPSVHNDAAHSPAPLAAPSQTPSTIE
jgi:hypothetical protein